MLSNMVVLDNAVMLSDVVMSGNVSTALGDSNVILYSKVISPL